MTFVLGLEINERDHSNFARTGDITIGRKTISSPVFCPLIKTREELKVLLELIHGRTETKHIGGAVIRLVDANKVLTKESLIHFDFTTGKPINLLEAFRKNSLVIIDPCMDLTWPSKTNLLLLQKAGLIDPLSSFVKDSLRLQATLPKSEYDLTKQDTYLSFWNNLVSNPAERDWLIRSILEKQTTYGADVLLPPVPVITSKKLLEVSLQINYYSSEYSRKIFGKDCPLMFILRPFALNEEWLVKEVERAIADYPTSLTVLKFKGLDLLNDVSGIQRTRYVETLKRLAALFRGRTRALAILENGYASFISLHLGADLVSSGMGTAETDGVRRKSATRGSWFDPTRLVRVPFADVARMYKETGLPCSCPSCRQSKNFVALRDSEWNKARRSHYLWTMAEYINQLEADIGRGRITKTRDWLAKSSLGSLAAVME